MNNDIILKNNIKQVRSELKISQEELAHLKGTTRHNYCNRKEYV